MEWKVFVCYRQEDGSEAAAWLHKNLHGAEIFISGAYSQTPVTLSLYFDTAAAAVSDWQSFHANELSRARAFLLVCTPGSSHDFGSDDWVHREVDYWLTHRTACPIIVDATRQGHRWVPDTILKRWPNVQLVKLSLKEWGLRPEVERQDLLDGVRDRIIGGIKLSEQTVRLEEIGRQMARSFVEQAERAVVDGDELTANMLLSHAYASDQDEDIRDHLLVHLHVQMGEIAMAKSFFERLLKRKLVHAKEYLAVPALVDRLVLKSTIRAALDSRLLQTATLGEVSYGHLWDFKAMVGRSSFAERRLYRLIGRREPQIYRILQDAHRRISNLCLQPDIDSVNLIWPTLIIYLATPWVNQLPHPGRSEALRRP